MPVSLKDLTTPPTEDEILDSFLVVLGLGGFPITSWASGGVARTILKVLSKGIVNLSTLIANAAGGGLLATSVDAWLTLLAQQVYGVQRYPATFTAGQLTLANASGGPYTITVGQLTFQWQGLFYKNTAGGSLLGSGGTLTIGLVAQSPGPDYNFPFNAPITMTTPLAGVSIVSDPASPLPLPQVTTQGADQESDAAVVIRCLSRWGTTGSAANATGYAKWALDASAQVTRVAVSENDNGGTPTPGWVTVTLAGPSGPVSGAVVSAVTLYIYGNPSDPLQIARRPLCDLVRVQSATSQTISSSPTLFVKAGTAGAASAVQQAWAAYARTLRIATRDGGYTVTGGVTVFAAKLIEIAEEQLGVVNVNLGGLGDTNVAYGHVAVLSLPPTVVFV